MFRLSSSLLRGPDVTLHQFKSIVLSTLHQKVYQKNQPVMTNNNDKRQQKLPLLIDIRREDELETVGKVPMALHVPLVELEETLLEAKDYFQEREQQEQQEEEENDEFEERLVEIGKPGNRHLVFFCRQGIRSLTAMAIAEDCGYRSFSHYPGGFNEYSQSPVSDKDVADYVQEQEEKKS